jgi:uncharacterized protein with HEPN domain
MVSDLLLLIAFEEDIKLPTQSTNAILRTLFYICEQIQSINSAILDQVCSCLYKYIYGINVPITAHYGQVKTANV